MRTLYLDCGMGAAGDMLTAAVSSFPSHFPDLDPSLIPAADTQEVLSSLLLISC